ncbi:MAG: hypothetical protein RLZ47_386 [Bacteroidota bacterium]|jgi:hypothetical protein
MKTKTLFILFLLASILSCRKEQKTHPYPTDGLISYFNFDDNLKDQHGYSFDGDPTGNPTFTVGKAGKSLSFDGIGQDVIFQSKNPQKSQNITIACWFKTGFNDLYDYMLRCYNPTNSVGMFTNSGNVGFVVSHPATDNCSGLFVPDQWNHVVGSFDGTSIRIYINGVLVATKAHPGTIFGFNDFLQLGKFNNYFWAGSIDDLFIYHKVLSPEEVQTLYQLH